MSDTRASSFGGDRRKPIRRRVEVVIRKGNKVLVGKYFRRTTQEYFYALPGGGIDGEETGTDAAVREVLEEVGVDIRNVKDLNIMTDSPPPYFIPNYKFSRVITEWFVADYAGENLEFFNTARDGIVERMWLEKKDALEHINDSLYAPGAIKAIKKVLE